MVAEHLGPDIYADPAFPTLLGRLRAVELGGHDVQAEFTEAFEQRSMTGAGSQAQVMHWRVGKLVEDRTPDYTAEEVTERTRATVRPAWEELAEQHRDRAAATGDRVETFLATLAGKAGERTEELGAAAAAEPPAWATEWLGPLPDQQADLDAHRQWVVDAGQVAAYREYRGVPDTQISIGEAPAPSQQLAHELWTRAAAVGAGDPRAIDWRQATDAHLRDAIERWEREQQWSPPQVSAELGEALALAHDASNDAVLGRARLDTMAPDDPGRERLEARVRADEVMAEQATGFAASLDAGHTARARRGIDLSDTIDPTVDSERPTGTTKPEPEQHATREEQQVLPLDLEPQGQGRSAEQGRGTEQDREAEQGRDNDRVERHQRFLDGIAATRERQLAEIDPDRQLSPEARNAALRERNLQEFTAELRAQHGQRLRTRIPAPAQRSTTDTALFDDLPIRDRRARSRGR